MHLKTHQIDSLHHPGAILVMQSSCLYVKQSNTKQSECSPTYLAGQDVSKCRKGVIESLVINGLIQVLDEDVAHSTLPQGGVPLRPHDAERPAFDHIEVHGVQGSLSCEKTGPKQQNPNHTGVQCPFCLLQ